MTDFIINEPYHKRWWLPDGLHQYNCVLHGDQIRVTIWEALTGRLILSCPTIFIDPKGEWKDTLALTQELTNKRFAPILRARRRAS